MVSTPIGDGRQSVLITGGAGMVGANLAARLVAEGHDVSVFVRPTTDLLRLKSIGHDIRSFTGDVRDPESVSNVMDKVSPDVVYHLASTRFNPPTISMREHFDVIAVGTLNVLESMIGANSVRLVHVGSAAEYSGGNHIRETDLPSPATALGAAKAAATLLVQTFTRLHNIDAVILRLFTPFGPWESPRRLIPHTILSALQGVNVEIINGKPQRDFVFIGDAVSAIIKAGTAQFPTGTVMNVCSGQGTTVLDVVNLTLRLMGNPVDVNIGSAPPRADEIWEMSGEFDHTRKYLDWKPRLSLEEGLLKSIKWFSDNRQLANQLS